VNVRNTYGMKGTRIGRLLADLQKAARQQKISKVELARRAGIHPNTLRYFRTERSRMTENQRPWNPTPAVIAALERVLLGPAPRSGKEKQTPEP
jgi:transposase-like protein